jgi:16S rRNA (guanine527-N7)-methyltransferase
VEPTVKLPEWIRATEDQLRAYAALLANQGTERGLIGPREVPRLWDRHLLNCAVVADPSLGLVPYGARIADIGSGAGLPGLVWAIVRPDVCVALIEALLRRATFLEEVVRELGLQDRVEVIRSRAEDCARDVSWRGADVVTARAVAPLATLLGWMVPLMTEDGVALALKGERARQELDVVLSDPSWAQRRESLELRIDRVGTGLVEPPTTVVVARRRTAQ